MHRILKHSNIEASSVQTGRHCKEHKGRSTHYNFIYWCMTNGPTLRVEQHIGFGGPRHSLYARCLTYVQCTTNHHTIQQRPLVCGCSISPSQVDQGRPYRHISPPTCIASQPPHHPTKDSHAWLAHLTISGGPRRASPTSCPTHTHRPTSQHHSARSAASSNTRGPPHTHQGQHTHRQQHL